jgi:hypothetical protein
MQLLSPDSDNPFLEKGQVVFSAVCSAVPGPFGTCALLLTSIFKRSIRPSLECAAHRC